MSLPIDSVPIVDNNVLMRIIKKNKLEEFFIAHPQGKQPLMKWFALVRKARWKNLVEMRTTFPSADAVKVKSGRTAVVFNIKRNDYRLITAVHFEKPVQSEKVLKNCVEGKVFLFFFLTHAEYNKGTWKDEL